MLGKWKKQAEEEARQILDEARLAAAKIREEAEELADKQARLLTLREQGLTGRLADLAKHEAEIKQQRSNLGQREADLAAEWEKLNDKNQDLLRLIKENSDEKSAFIARRDELDQQGAALEARETAIAAAESRLLEQQAELDRLALDLKEKKQTLDEQQSELEETVRKAIADAVANIAPAVVQKENEQEEPVVVGPIEGPLAPPKEEEMIDPTLRYRLPNAMVGKPYEVQLASLTPGPDATGILSVAGLAEQGLHFDPETKRISGEPLAAIELELQVTYLAQERDPEAPDMYLELLINPDPRSMWKELPADPSAPFPKSTDATNYGRLGSYVAVGASKRGRSHAHKGTHRDDHILIENIDEDWMLMAVADGAGSAEVSREGSRLACEATAAEIKERWAAQKATIERLISGLEKNTAVDQQEMHNCFYNVIGGGLYAARNAINKSAEAQGLRPRDYYTTLLLTLVRPWEGGIFVCQYGVGDGAIALHRAGEMAVLLNTPDGGEFAGQTRFLNMTESGESQDIWKRISFRLETQAANVILMTDGVSDPLFGTDAALAQPAKWDELWEQVNGKLSKDEVTSATELLAWLDFWSPGNHDDRSIIIFYQPD